MTSVTRAIIGPMGASPTGQRGESRRPQPSGEPQTGTNRGGAKAVPPYESVVCPIRRDVAFGGRSAERITPRSARLLRCAPAEPSRAGEQAEAEEHQAGGLGDRRGLGALRRGEDRAPDVARQVGRMVLVEGKDVVHAELERAGAGPIGELVFLERIVEVQVARV